MNAEQLDNLRRLEAAAREAMRAVQRARTIVFVVKSPTRNEWLVLRADVGSPDERQYVDHCATKVCAESLADQFAQTQGFTRVVTP